jgi:trimeric autotransporter adhesin
MKKLTTTLVLFVIGMFILKAQTNTFPASGSGGIGTITPNASSLLEVKSTTQGMLVPRMTLIQRDAIATPATGLLIYQTNSTPGFYYFTGTVWTALKPSTPSKTLNNLTAPTKINTELLPDTGNTIDLGASTQAWKNLFLNGSIFLDGNRFLHNSGSGNTFLGLSAGEVNTIGTNNTFVGNNAGHFNALTSNNSFFGSGTGLNNAANSNSFFGNNAGIGNTTGTLNCFFGESSGAASANAASSNNSFFGAFSGDANIIGANNAFFGKDAGGANTTASNNSFFGANSGDTNTTGTSNAFFGKDAGGANISASDNSFFGAFAGDANTTGTRNSFFGKNAGGSNSTGNNNTCFGDSAGLGNVNGSNNLFLGQSADVSGGITLNNASAIGANSFVEASNTMAFGNLSNICWAFGRGSATLSSMALQVGCCAANGNGANLTKGGAWTNSSSRSLKEDFQTLDKSEVLKKVNALYISRWKYIGTETPEYHIGPIAEEFYAAFKTGIEDKSISTIDPSGVALVAIQALSEKNDELKTEVGGLKTEDGKQKAEIEELKREGRRQKAEIENLKSCIESLCNNSDKQSSVLGPPSSAILFQNLPNPFDNSTIIPFRIPKECHSAAIIIAESTGKIVRAIPVSCKETQLLLEAGLLAHGVYSYSLVVDGITVETRQMILTK